jgi:hypothetical protein
MTQSSAQIAHFQKMQLTKRELEDEGGKRIKADKIQEWALLEIAERLSGIELQLAQISGQLHHAGELK